MTYASLNKLQRIGRKGLATALIGSLVVLMGSQGLQTATANGDTRSISFFHTHTRETINITFKQNGRYDQDALKKLNYFLRDWRNNDVIKMDPRLFDLIWEVNRETGGRAPIQIVSSYRSPKTNAMLRSRSKAVAKHSQHTLGKAMDFRIPGVSADRIREVGLRLQRGGVGYYPSGQGYFIHLDTGSVRHWPRMTRTQLARVFPDGRTVHLPADGKPMPGYQLALADIQRGRPSSETASGGSGRSLFARLFNSDEEEDGRQTAAAPVRTASAPPAAAIPAPLPTAAPVALETQPTQVAALSPALPEPRPVSFVQPDNVRMASLGGAPRMVWQTGAGASDITPQAAPVTASLAPALPSPRPSASQAQESITSLVAAYAPEVPLPLRSPIRAGLTTALPVADVQRTAAITRRGASFKTASAEPKAELVTARQTDVGLKKVMVPERIVRGPSASELSHPDQTHLASLIAMPTRTLAQTFGGNPTGGLRSDAFQGRAVALLRSVRVDTASAPRGMTLRGG